MVKFICSKCESEIRNFQVLSKNMMYSTDYTVTDWIDHIKSPTKRIVCKDREYLSGYVEEVIFDCHKCGSIKINKKDCLEIKDFIREIPKGSNLQENDIVRHSYGLIMVIEDDY